jgi:diguanylate cyclase (GGDEF)-like protein/PAS domain S-box-containing protein
VNVLWPRALNRDLVTPITRLMQAELDLLVERMRALTGASSSHIMLVEDGVLVQRAVSGRPPKEVRVPWQRGLPGVALRTREPVVCRDTETDDRAHRDAARAAGVRSVVVAPVLAGGDPLGVLVICSAEPGAFGTRDGATLELLAAVLSAAIGQAAALTSFRTLFEGASVGIVRIDSAGCALEANATAQQMIGYGEAELRALGFADVIHPDHLTQQLALHAELMAGERTHYELEKRLVTRDGRTLWAHTRTSYVPPAAGEPASALVMVQDITERKLAEIALREHGERLARVIDTQRDIDAAGLDLDRVMDLIVERAMDLTRADGAMVSMIEGDELVVAAARGNTAPVGARRPVTASASRFAIAARETLLIEDATSDPRINREWQSAIGNTSLICLPLFGGDAPVGVLNVMSGSETDRLDEEDRWSLELLAVGLSGAVSRAAEFRAKRDQLEALARFEAVFANAVTGMMLVALGGPIVAVNPALEELIGRPAREIEGRAADEFVHPDDREAAVASARSVLKGEARTTLEHRFVRADGGIVWVEASLAKVDESDVSSGFIVAMVQEITQRRHAEDALRAQAELNQHQALHDALTGLPNRTLFRDRIEQSLHRARRSRRGVAVLMLDLDRFKEVNDSLGHAAGDALLVELSRRLDGMLRASDTIARLGGDEFGVLLPDPCSLEDVMTAAERVRAAIQEPVIVQGLPLSVDASIGIALFPRDGVDVETLLQHADVAMYHAKHENAGCALYDAARHDGDPLRLTLVGELRRALEERELMLHYQPKARLCDGVVGSVEALLRWQHPARGLVPPDEFIPTAQQTGLIKPLTLYVLDEALRQCRAWLDDGLRLAIAVNLSTRNLMDADLPPQVAALLARHGVNGRLLEIEITESTVLADPARTRGVLEQLAALGVRISIDDFGTGYSSLSHLRRLPVDEIKVDRSFVMAMDRDEDDATIVRSTIELGRNLGLDVVAEGVESQAIWDRLVALGCTYGQGYHLSRPLPASELAAWCESRARSLAR